MHDRSSRLPLAILVAVGIAAVALSGGLAGVAMLDDSATPSSPGLASASDHELVHQCAEEPPDDLADPADGNETIGWFDGYWYSEELDIDVEDGITEDELEKLSARTAARFEAMRCLTFEEIPPVEVVDRDTFAEETAEQFTTVDEETRAFDNAQFETLLLIGSEEDSIDVREEDRTATVGGYYNFVDEEIVVISDDGETLLLDEAILAHELGHALQDQHFGLAGYERNTHDLDVGKLGVIEGDVHRIEHEYLEHCEEGRWNEECVIDDGPEDEPGEAGEPPVWGLYFMQFQPYSDGPNFVDHVYEEGGWEAVDALYDEMPRSALEVIYPEKYGEVDPDEFTDLSVEDRSGDDWDRLTADGEQEYNVIGQSGLSAIFMDPAYDDDPTYQQNPIVAPEEFLNYDETGEVDTNNPLNYDLDVSDGWRGDRLYAYEDGEGGTGTVWKLAWRDSDEAETFLHTYERLIEYRGGERVDETHTYEFDEGSGFDMALRIGLDDDRVWIVTAPSVDELDEVHDVEPLDYDAIDEGGDDVADDEATDDETDEEATDDRTTDDEEGEDGASDSIPGFVALTSFVALASVLVVNRIWHHTR